MPLPPLRDEPLTRPFLLDGRDQRMNHRDTEITEGEA
jgi:hypothetical protein